MAMIAARRIARNGKAHRATQTTAGMKGGFIGCGHGVLSLFDQGLFRQCCQEKVPNQHPNRPSLLLKVFSLLE
jgi:hypothetical protein